MEDAGGGLTQQNSLPVYLDDYPGLVLLHTVAFLVELGEGVGHLVHEVAQGVKQQVIRHPVENFSEPDRKRLHTECPSILVIEYRRPTQYFMLT